MTLFSYWQHDPRAPGAQPVATGDARTLLASIPEHLRPDEDELTSLRTYQTLILLSGRFVTRDS